MPRRKKDEIWRHFTTTVNKFVKCKFCEKLYTKANVNKMERHLKKCFKCPAVIRNQFSTSLNQNPTTEDRTLSDVEHFETQSDETSSSSHLIQSFEITEDKKKYLDLLLSKAIFVSGAPISMVEHPLWIKIFKELQPLYKLPSRKLISTNYLDTIYSQMEKEISEELKSASNLHLQCDGWSNQRTEGIINFIIAKPEPIFVKSLNTTWNRHTSDYLCQEILKVINVYGGNKTFTLIGDNANNIQKAFDLVQNTYPHIIPLRCIAHTLNLLCEDCLKPEPVRCFMKIVINIIKTVKRSQVLSALLAQIVKDKGHGETLKLPVKTRWGSYLKALKSLQNTKVALQTLAVHEEAKLPSDVKAHLLDERIWEMIDECIKLLHPITEKIFKLEANEMNIHQVYISFKDIKSSLTFILPDLKHILNEDDKIQILSVINSRMEMCLKPIHLAAYMLDPKSQGVELNEDEEAESMEFLCNVGHTLHIDVMPDLANYRAKEGYWSKKFVWANIDDISPVVWWKGICKSKPLSTVAVRILTAPCTSAATERTFSVLGCVHTAKRNRLTTERAAKISYISYNWNLLKKHQEINVDDEENSSLLPHSPTKGELNEPSTSGEHFTHFESLDVSNIRPENESDSD